MYRTRQVQSHDTAPVRVTIAIDGLLPPSPMHLAEIPAGVTCEVEIGEDSFRLPATVASQ